MHWIKRFRQQVGIDRNELAKGVKKYTIFKVDESRPCMKILGKKVPQIKEHNVGCTENLIDILEHGGITHPAIAAVITLVCGGTAENWNSIVHEDYHGQWKPGQKIEFKPRFDVEAEGRMAITIVSRGEAKRGKLPKTEKPKKEPKPKPAPKPPKPPKPQQPKLQEHQRRPVVEIDTTFQEVKRYADPELVARAMGTRLRSITMRCDRQMAYDMDEMQRFRCTWRYADEWDAMTPEQRTKDMDDSRKRHTRERKNASEHEGIPEAGHADQQHARP